MGGHNADYGGPRMFEGCSLGAFVARPPRCVARMCEGPALARSPSRSPSQRAPVGQSGGRPLGRAFLCGGPPFPAPPAPPSPYMFQSVGVGVSIVCGCGGRYLSFVVVGSVAVFGAPRSSSVLRALARMPDAARCAPLPAPVPANYARVVSGCARVATWRAVGPSALNGPARAPRAPSRLLELAFGVYSRILGPVFVT